MKRIFAAALAVTLMTGSVLAEARDHDRDRYSRHERSHRDHDRHAVKHHRDHRAYERRSNDRHWDDHRRDSHRDDRWERREYRSAAAHHYVRFHAGHYHRPAGYRHYAWHRGAHLPRAYYAPRYVVHDYHAYRLHRPPYGHHWVRVDRDVVLTAIATGAVIAVVSDLFY